jgi:hypothetical protein
MKFLPEGVVSPESQCLSLSPKVLLIKLLLKRLRILVMATNGGSGLRQKAKAAGILHGPQSAKRRGSLP